MILYLLKSAACLAILIVVYHLLLEREKMHRINRFYLLFSLLFSFIAPLFVFETVVPYVATNAADVSIINSSFLSNNTIEEASYLSQPSNYIYIVYAIMFVILFIRFSKNIMSLVFKATKNPIKRWKKASLVLLPEKILPHSFLQYIYLEENAFRQQKIEKELLQHELEHVKQKHSLDILLVELLQIVFWFNPILFLYKKAIKLNHEFLADTAVLTKHKNIVYYQQLLLATASFNTQNYMASSINYSVTKKRLEMMTKHTKTAKAWIKSLVLIPLFSFLLYSFSETVEVTDPLIPETQQHIISDKISAEARLQKILSIKFSNETVFVDGKQTTVSNFAKTIDQLTKSWTDSEIKDASLHIRLNNAPDSLVDQLSTEYGKTRFAKINGHKMLPPPPPAPPAPPKVLKGQTSNIPPPPAPKPNTVNEATNLKTGFIKINGKEHFFVNNKGESKYYNRWGVEVNKNGKELNGSRQIGSDEVVPGQYITKVYKDDRIVSEFNDISPPPSFQAGLSELPPPPAPPIPSEHMKELAAKGAVFYLEEKSITSKQAIKIAKDNEDINILIRDHDTKKPIVKLSTKPMRIKR